MASHGQLGFQASEGLGRTLSKPTSSLTATASSGSRLNDVYISELLSYSLERLRKEPELLSVEHERAERNIQHNTVAHYKAFIETASCLQTVHSELDSVSSHLDALLQDTPQLASVCEAFSKDAAGVMQQQAENKQLLLSQTTLLELLEAPQLMDTCVRNGIYDEALDLQAFIGRLGMLHPELPIVQLLMAQVRQVSGTMLQQLLQRLQANIQLPECLRVIGYLRRLAAFSEPELRLHFLKCREEWFTALVEELDEGDPYEYIKHLTDVYRLHLFDVVMQYRAIFFDSAPAAKESTAAAGGGSGLASYGSTGAAAAAASAAHLRDSSVLYSWVQHRVGHYLQQLAAHLPSITEGGNLASVLEHCMYCGSSLSRVGLEFQGLLQPIFQDCALQLFTANLTAAVDAFNGRLESHKWLPMPAPMLQRKPAAAAAAAATPAAGEDDQGAAARADGSADAADGSSPKAAVEEDLSPPYVILEHLPLAVFTNGVLHALNELRHCALLALARPLADLLQASLEQVASALVHYKHTHKLGPTEVPLFRSAARAHGEVVAPYLASCFGRIFPGSAAKPDTSAAVAVLKEVLDEGAGL